MTKEEQDKWSAFLRKPTNKPLVGQFPRIEVSKLYVSGIPKKEKAVFSLKNGKNVENESFLRVRTQKNSVTLVFTPDRPWGNPEEPTVQKISVSWTPCHLGGQRPWFVCPGHPLSNGCGKRVTALFYNAGYWLCRHCHGLQYATMYLSEYQRLQLKLNAIHKRLGVSEHQTSISIKPKHMHRKVYKRLCKEARELHKKICNILFADDESLIDIDV